MHHEVADLAISERLNDLLRTVSDESLWALIDALTELPDVWRFVRDDMRNRLTTFITSSPNRELILFLDEALEIDGLRAAALSRIESVSEDALAALIGLKRRPEYANRVLDLYSQAKSYDHANVRATKLVEPMWDILDRGHLERLRDAAEANSQISGSWNWKDLKRKLVGAGVTEE
jgi:hypothetical protein